MMIIPLILVYLFLLYWGLKSIWVDNAIGNGILLQMLFSLGCIIPGWQFITAVILFAAKNSK